METQAAETAAPIDIVQVPVTGDNAVMSAREAARTLATLRHKQRDTTETTQATLARPEATAAETPSGETESATAETQPSGEQTEATDVAAAAKAAEQPIEPPKSWTAEQRERFASLPRETQEYLVEREGERDRDISRRQNEAAEKLKGLTAKEQAVEQARQQYETALPALLATLQQQQAGDFADIKTYEDLNNLAKTDWPRWIAYQQHQANIERVQQEVTVAQNRQQQEHQSKFKDYVARESELVRDKIPDMADPEKALKLQGKALKMLGEIGFKDDEIGQMGRGEKGLSIQDHRFQLLVHDAMLYREMKAAARTAQTKPVPPVQRPGVSVSRGAQQDAVVQNLTKRLDQTGNLKDAVRLLSERRKAG